MRARFLMVMAALLSGCGRAPEQPPEQANSSAANDSWDLESDAEGSALVLGDESGATVVRLYCAKSAGTLSVNVPSLKPIGSEDRLSFGSGGEVAALVADPEGGRASGGVTGTGPVEPNLAALLGGPISLSYGAQHSGPHPVIGAGHRRAFVAACQARPAGKPGEPVQPAVIAAGIPAACLSRDGVAVPPMRLRAVGTEPFWGTRIEGRCVTYSTPEDQGGTRVWTNFSGSAAAGQWSGFLNGRRFVLATRPEARCSDGMSDKVYPIAVTVTVGEDERRGCAEPL